MKPKHVIVAAAVTLGAIPLLMWMWHKVTLIQVDPVSEAWLASNAISEDRDPDVI